MRAFNPEKELRKIQHGNKNKIIFGIIALLLIVAIGSTYALYQVRYSKRIIYTKVAPFSNKDISILAVLVDGVERNSFPSPEEGVIFYKIDCENKEEGYTVADWNYDDWGLNLFSKGPNKCNVEFRTGGVFTYKGENNYTGEIQKFTVSKDGIYNLEVWGAQGGSTQFFNGCAGGLGGYSNGEIYLHKGEKLYVVVGGAGAGGLNHQLQYGGYNGGGKATPDNDGNTRQISGGGATHIATFTGTLSELVYNKESVLIVAGGGGGAAVNAVTRCVHGGAGGGLQGDDGEIHGGYSGPGATQISGGDNNARFGLGASGTYSGGGGGYYGGGGGNSGGGGSGYLNSKLNNNAITTNGVKEGNGLAKITLSREVDFTYKVNGKSQTIMPNRNEGYVYSGISCDTEVNAEWDYDRWEIDINTGSPKSCEVSFDIGQSFIYTENIQEYKVPKTGIYKLEVWGAQGGSLPLFNGCIGGLGGYSKGEVNLTEGETLYITIGGAGRGTGDHGVQNGGYNGGGTATSNGDGNTRQGSGGGATHIATRTGLLNTFVGETDNILIVAGGGGGSGANAGITLFCSNGGTGGGLIGGDGSTLKSGSSSWTGIGGTQDSGNAFGVGGNSITSGGGGGYYGGRSADYSAGGGSGFLSSKLNSGTTETTNGVREGNGFALITFVK